jgi:hypothetical protein
METEMLVSRVVPVGIAAGLLATACTEIAGPRPADIESVAFVRLDRPPTFGGTLRGRLVAIPPFAPESDPACNANFTGDPAAPGPSVSLFDHGSVDFSHVGRGRIVAVSCIDPLSPFSEGHGTITARNGDQLHIAFANFGLPSPTDPSLIAVEGTQWVTGGTGRFEGASGTQACTFTIQLTSPTHGEITGSCLGTLEYAAPAPVRR